MKNDFKIRIQSIAIIPKKLLTQQYNDDIVDQIKKKQWVYFIKFI